MSRKMIFLVSLALLALAVFARAQSVITPELLQQYQNRGGNINISPEQMRRLQMSQAAQAAQGQDTVKSESIFKTTAGDADSIARAAAGEEKDDFLDAAKQKGYLGYSVYEVMFKGVDLLPDDILPYLQMYGYESFAQRGSQGVKPGDMGSVPADYPIKVGDEVKVHLWGRINQEHLLTVDRNGAINIQHIGPVNVAGLPFSSMQRTVTDKLKNIEGVNVSLSMGELRPIGVYIVGEVKHPGFHTVSPLTSVTNALFAAGGMTNRGSLRSVQLRRRGKLVSEVDYYDFLMTGNDKSGLRLQSGDVIVVPIVRQMAAVVGNVRRSALYELKKPEKISDVLELAGGVSPAAWTSRIQVERYQDNQQRIVLDIDASDVSRSDFMVMDGDVVKVFPVLAKDENVVFLEGNALRPGKYEYKEGMKVGDIITAPSDLLPESYFEYAVLMRRTKPSLLEKVVTFNLGRVLENPASADNIALEPFDRLIVYHRDFFDPDRTASIDGAVNIPGAYKLFEGMTIRDMILQAGGLKDDASTERGEIYRRKLEGESGNTERIEFSIMDAMLGNAGHNIALRRADKIFIRNRRNWEEERRVKLTGQFVYPGTYMIFEGETLGDLIKRAGGFRDDAYLPAAIFTRTSVREMEVGRLQQYSKNLEMDIVRLSIEMASKGLPANALLEQQMRLTDMHDSTVILGRVMIDMTDESQYRTFLLEADDELFIPRDLNTVSVLGDVYNQGTFRFEKNRPTVSYYVNSAGGPIESANRKAMYVIRANGIVVSNKATPLRNVELAPGDVVVVPTKIRYPNNWKTFLDGADAMFKIATLLTTVITMIILINTLDSDSK